MVLHLGDHHRIARPEVLPGPRVRDEAHRLGITLREVDIDLDPDLMRRFNDDVPLLFHGQRELFRHHVDPEQLAAYVRGQRFESSLASERCVPCRGGVPPLAGTQLDELLRELDGGWRVVEEHHLEKEFTFPDFVTALAFTNAVGAIAEREGHHPDIHLAWGRVRITIWTHTIDGLTRSDFVLAAKFDAASSSS